MSPPGDRPRVRPRSSLALVRSIKVLHTVGAIGVMGGVATFVVVRLKGPAVGAGGYLEVRHVVDAAYRYLVVPSLVLCVLSGLASMIAHRPYWNALWAWLKAASGIALLGLTVRIQGVGRSLTAPEVLGDRAELADALRIEWTGLWTILVVLLLNVIVGIWRPRVVGRR